MVKTKGRMTMVKLPFGALKYSYEDFPENTDEVPGMKELRPDLSDPLMGLDIDIEYAVKDGMPLHVEILYPRYEVSVKEKYPLIMYIQGAAWRKQPIAREIPQLFHLAKKGFVIAVVEHRPSTTAPFPAQIRDTLTATRFLLENADAYHIDTNNVFVWGHSSGGHTAVMANLTKGDTFFSDEKDAAPIDFRGCIDYFGVTDIYRMGTEPSSLEAWAPDSPQGQLIGGLQVDQNRELAWKASPLAYIDPEKDIAPTLIMHGSKDRLVPFRQSVYLFEALKKAGKSVDFYRIAGADHSIHPTFAAFFSEEAMQIVETFIRNLIVR